MAMTPMPKHPFTFAPVLNQSDITGPLAVEVSTDAQKTSLPFRWARRRAWDGLHASGANRKTNKTNYLIPSCQSTPLVLFIEMMGELGSGGQPASGPGGDDFAF